MAVDANVAGDDGANKKNKVVENDEEEPRSKMPSDARPSDNAPSPSAPKLCDLPANFNVFCINKFDVVTVGKEAGWPGQWEEVVNEEMSEEQLLYSLQVKGSAMSDEAWQQHWAQVGPGLLAAGWLERYPTIPLSQVEQITGVTFLTWSVQSNELTDAVEKLSLSESSIPSEGTESKEEVNASVDPPDLSGLSINENVAESEAHNALELVVSDGKITDESKPQQQNFSNEEIAELWSNFYNQYYWDCYKQFVGVVGGASQQSGKNLIEDYLADKRRYEPADVLVEPEEEPVDNKLSLAPDSKAVGQNATVVKIDQVNSESVVEVVAPKDSPVDVNILQNGTLPCSDPQEECKKETSDLHECGSQTEELPSQEDSKSGLPDSQERCGEEKSEELTSQEDSKSGLPDSQEHCGEEKSEELPSQEDSKSGLPDSQERCGEEKSEELPSQEDSKSGLPDSQEHCGEEKSEELTSQEDSKSGLPDSQECCGEEKSEELPSQEDSKNGLPDSQERCGEEKSEELPSQEDSKNGLPDSQEHCGEEESNPEQLSNGKDDHPPPNDNNNKTAPKAEAKAVWQLSKSAQYTSIVWVLQEAGIIVSGETSSEVVNNQTPCSDQVHCNGVGSDKETHDCEGDTNTNETSRVVSSMSSDAIPSSSSAVDDSHNQPKQPLKRKR